MKACPECKNEYLAIRTDLYKDGREFTYCDCCGFIIQTKSEHLIDLPSRFHEALHAPSTTKDTLGMLYEAFERLPICNILGVVGAAIQDLQYHQQELAKRQEQFDTVLNRIEELEEEVAVLREKLEVVRLIGARMELCYGHTEDGSFLLSEGHGSHLFSLIFNDLKRLDTSTAGLTTAYLSIGEQLELDGEIVKRGVTCVARPHMLPRDLEKMPRCFVCGTRDNVSFRGGHQMYTCDNPECIPF